jgi:hypothetical protein
MRHQIMCRLIMGQMRRKGLLLAAAAAIAALAAGLPARVNAQQNPQGATVAVEIDDHAVGGVVTSRT